MTADDRAWALFAEALDAGSAAAARVPNGAAILAADSPDREVLIRRYHDEGRAVVLVEQDGREHQVLAPNLVEDPVTAS